MAGTSGASAAAIASALFPRKEAIATTANWARRMPARLWRGPDPVARHHPGVLVKHDVAVIDEVARDREGQVDHDGMNGTFVLPPIRDAYAEPIGARHGDIVDQYT